MPWRVAPGPEGRSGALRAGQGTGQGPLAAVDGVTEVHDLHVSTLVPGKDMVTAHLTSNGQSSRVLDDARAILAARGLDHATVQVETPGSADECPGQTGC